MKTVLIAIPDSVLGAARSRMGELRGELPILQRQLATGKLPNRAQMIVDTEAEVEELRAFLEAVDETPVIALTPDLAKSLKIVRDAATACDNDDPDFIVALDTAMTAVDEIVYAAHEAERG